MSVNRHVVAKEALRALQEFREKHKGVFDEERRLIGEVNNNPWPPPGVEVCRGGNDTCDQTFPEGQKPPEKWAENTHTYHDKSQDRFRSSVSFFCPGHAHEAPPDREEEV